MDLDLKIALQLADVPTDAAKMLCLELGCIVLSTRRGNGLDCEWALGASHAHLMYLDAADIERGHALRKAVVDAMYIVERWKRSERARHV